MSTDLDLQFRQAAASNNTSFMLQLYKKGIHINAAGPETGLTAVHRAAAAGHTSALHLLFNLGADFELLDKKGKRAEDLATDKSKIVFTLIKVGKEALAARHKVYPKTDEECSEAELRAFKDYRKRLKEEIELLYVKTLTSLDQSIKSELKTIPMEQAKVEKKLDTFNKSIEFITKYIFNVTVLKTTEVMKTKYKNRVCSCGEATLETYLNLINRPDRFFPFESITMGHNSNILMNHGVLVLNRDQKEDISTLTQSDSALAVDSYRDNIFFMEFLKDCDKDTVMKDLNNFKIEIFLSSNPPPFPNTFPLPKSTEVYEKMITITKENLTSDLSQSPPRFCH